MHKRILLTAGGTGGHIYPLLAVADKLLQIGEGHFDLEYIGPPNQFYDEFEKREIKTHLITPAKLRRYFSLKNIIDIPKFIWSIFEAIIKMYFIMPDIVFSKGGPGSFPTVLAARIYFIPVIIHESDSIPSLNSRFSAKFANRIAISFRKTFDYFPKEKTFLSGNPIREELLQNWMEKTRAKRYLKFNPEIPLILILGGSQGSQRINEFVIDHLDKIIPEFQIYHQLGAANIENMRKQIDFSLKDVSPEQKDMYHYAGFLKPKDLKYTMNAADIILSRAGAGAISEISTFGKPAILVPLEESANSHQEVNAYEYAGNGGAIVIKEGNLGIAILINQIKKIVNDQEKMEKMSQAAKSFTRPDADDIIVREILNFLR